MPSATNALVRLTIPALDADDDPASVSLSYMSTGADTSADVGLLVAQVPHLFTQIAAGATFALGSYIGKQMDRGADHCRVDVYDVGGHLDGLTPHGSPVASGTWTLPAALSDNPWPSGVAAAVSFRSDYGSDVEFGAGTRPRSRDRGRFYVGPLDFSVGAAASPTFRQKLSAAFIADALADLQQVVTISELLPPDTWSLAVWSRKNASMKPVTELWMDDRPDYQRRRSDPGTKTFRSAT